MTTDPEFLETVGEAAAERLEAAFERAGARIETILGDAARSGETSFSRMTEAILADLARLAAQRFIFSPLESALGGLTPNGARAEGGPVAPGQAYLVGERGAEVFTPTSSGQISPAMPAITVNLTLEGGPDPARVEASEGRIARAIARAALKGGRAL